MPFRLTFRPALGFNWALGWWQNWLRLGFSPARRTEELQKRGERREKIWLRNMTLTSQRYARSVNLSSDQRSLAKRFERWLKLLSKGTKARVKIANREAGAYLMVSERVFASKNSIYRPLSLSYSYTQFGHSCGWSVGWNDTGSLVERIENAQSKTQIRMQIPN